uniref:Uncharacterized protein n=1 Tax=Pseudomonas aeruginosa TaxID=287 RepID=A0A5E5R2A0_PSEAI|nr:hypothetical protein TUEID40_02852 [Pseudomonas aeruginosa]
MPGANPASEEVMSLQRPIPSLARPLSRLSPLTLALRWALLGLSAAGAGLLGGDLAHAQSVGQHSAATRLDDATPRSYDIRRVRWAPPWAPSPASRACCCPSTPS